MKMDRNEIIKDIDAAFAGISLEDGIGILEAIAIDYCVSDKKREQARKNDVREDWHLLSEEVIGRHYQAMCFMDEKGLRFHLPAYMTFALRNFDTSDSASIDWAIYALCKEPEEINCNWTSFTEEQKTTIAKFLKFMATEAGDKWVDAEQAVAIYNKTWHSYDITKT